MLWPYFYPYPPICIILRSQRICIDLKNDPNGTQNAEILFPEAVESTMCKIRMKLERMTFDMRLFHVSAARHVTRYAL